MVSVKVPATTANMGPGFDSLGCALTLYARLDFEEMSDGISITGCPEEFRGPENLAALGYYKTIHFIGAKKRGLKVNIRSDIPVSRGLGGSAALIAAGSAAANRIHGNTLSKKELLKICCEIEGHPDNLAAAIYGGFTASFTENGTPAAVNLTVSEKIRFFALVPDFKVETRRARQALPDMVSFADAVFNVSRVPVLCRALETGDIELIGLSMKDRLHQPYRKNLIRDYELLRSICFDSGCAAFFISGSGPTCMCVADDGFGQRLIPCLNGLSSHWDVLPMSVDREGAVIL